MKTKAGYKVGDLNKSISKRKSSEVTKVEKSTTYSKLAELFSSSEDTRQKPNFKDVVPANTIIHTPKSKEKQAKVSQEADTTEQKSFKKLNFKKKGKKNNVDENKRTIFVGNLPKLCTRKKLGKIFLSVGSIESIRIRSVARSDPTLKLKVAAIKGELHPDVKNVNAYVRFKSEDAAKAALAMNGIEVDGFHLRVDLADGAQQHDHKKSVFLGNLNFKIEEEKVRRHFEDCGEIVTVRLVRDKATRIGKGFGYVQFKEVQSVELALKLNQSELDGRPIRISRCEREDKMNTTSTSRQHRRKRQHEAPMKRDSSFQARRRISAKNNGTKLKRKPSKFRKNSSKNQ